MGRLYDAYVEVGPRFAGFGDIQAQGQKAGKEYAKALVDAAEKAAKADARRIGEVLAKARAAEADAAGKVRVAEEKLNEVRDSGKAKASAIAAAEEALAAAQRKSAAAADSTKDATEALGKAQQRVSDAAAGAGKTAGGKFSGAFRSGLSKLGGDQAGKEFATRFGVGMNGVIGGIVSRSAGVFVAGFAAIKSAQVFGGFIKDAADSARVGRMTAQVITSTGSAAKITAGQVGDLATAISNKTGADDETIQSGANMLLTFTGIRNEVGKNNDIFNQATQTVTDLAAAMNNGQVTTDGVKTASIQLGKALNDPVKGITALQKVGVSFTDGQKKQIATLVKSGKTMEAQKVILGELNKEFGGAAAAAGDPFTRLTTIFGNLGEQLGGYLLPYANKFANFISDKLIPGVSGLSDLLLKGDFTSAFRQAFNVEEDSGLVTFLLKIHAIGAKVFTELTGGIRAFGAAWVANNGDVTSSGFPGFMEKVANAAHQAFDFFKTSVLPVLKSFGGFIISNVLPALGRLVSNLVSTFGPAIKDVFGFIKTDVIPRLKDFGSFLGDKILPKISALATSLSKNKDFLIPFAATIATIVGALKLWTIAQAALDIVLSANPIGLVVIAIAALVGGLVYAYKHSEKFRDIVNGAFNAVKATAVAVFGAVKTAVSAVVTAFDATKNAIGTAVSAVGSAFGAVKSAIGTAVSAVGGAVSAVVGAVKSAFGAAVGFVKSVWSGIVSAVSGPIQAVLGVLKAVWSRIAPVLALPFYIAKTVISKVFAAIQVVFSTVAGWVKSAFSKAWSVVTGVLSGPVNLAKSVIIKTWTGITTTFTAAKGFVVGAFSKAWAAVKNVLTGPVNLAKSAIDTTWSGIKTAFNATKDFVTGAFARAWAAIKTVITAPITLARTAISGILGNAKGGLQYIFSTAVSAISSIWNRLGGLAKAPIKFIVNTVLNDGLIGGFNWIANKFQAPTIKPIPLPKGFAQGGFTGRLPGPPSSKDNLIGYAKGGTFGLAGGEFVVNAKQTAKHLPMLQAVNDGKDGYADGGLIGSLKTGITNGFNAAKNFGADALNFLKDPAGWLKQRFAGPLGKLNDLGGSPFAQIVKAVPAKIGAVIADKAKALLGLGPSVQGPGVTLNIGSQVGTGANRWRGVALSALAAAGEPASWINSLLRRMNQESGGNPNAINLWDSNAAHGDPSKGLMQTIGSTFNAYAGPYRSRGIYDPFANIYAAIKYTVARYGSGPAGWDRKGGYKLGGLVGYETGAWKIPRDQIAKIHQGEMVVPAKPAEYLRNLMQGFGGGEQRVRSKLHQLHEAHLAHVAHVDHLNHANDWGRLIGRPRPGTVSGDLSNGLITLHPDTIDAIGTATAGALKSSPLRVAVDLDGRKLDTALSRSALGRGY